LLRNVYSKNAHFSGNGVKTSSVSEEANRLTTAASETVKPKDSTRCLIDRLADGYNRQTQTEAEQRSRSELAEVAELRRRQAEEVLTDRRASRVKRRQSTDI
jgi:hypothetical protein